MWLSTLPRRFGIILSKILDCHERSESPSSGVGGGGGGVKHHYKVLYSAQSNDPSTLDVVLIIQTKFSVVIENAAGYRGIVCYAKYVFLCFCRIPIQESQKDSPFPTGHHKADRNKYNSQAKTNTITKKIHKRSTAFERSVRKLLEGYSLKVPFTTAADDKFCDIFLNFRQK